MVDFNKPKQYAQRRDRDQQLREVRERLTLALPDLPSEDLQILSCIGYTELSTFFELCNALRKLNICPAKGDKAGWSGLFQTLGHLENEGYVDIVRKGRNMESVQLTEQGAQAVRQWEINGRPIIKLLEEKSANPDEWKSSIPKDGMPF